MEMADQGREHQDIGFYKTAKEKYGEPVCGMLKNWANCNRKLAARHNDRIFMLKCRSNNVVPSHIIQHVKCTYRLYKDKSIVNNDVRRVVVRFQRDLLNIEIKFIIGEVKRLTTALREIKTELLNILDSADYSSFLGSQNLFYEKSYLKIKDNQMAKFMKLIHVHDSTKLLGCFVNLTNVEFPDDAIDLLSYGPKFGLPFSYHNYPIDQIIADVELGISNIKNCGVQDELRANCTNIITNFINKSKFIKDSQEVKLLKTVNKTKNFLKEKDDILIVKSDKTNSTVAIMKSDYEAKMLKLLEDVDTYLPLKKDPTNKIQNLNNKICMDLFKRGKIDLITKNRLVKYNSTSPRMYGLVKNHKDGNPLRPVVSFINSPTYESAKFLSNILKELSSKKYNIADSFDAFSKLKEVCIPSNYILASLDVASLFTNIPLNLIFEIINNNWSTLKVSTKLDKQEFLDLFKLCCEGGYLQYGEMFYSMINGVAMGSPIAPIIADIVMNNLLDNITEKTDVQLPFIFKYVDDLILAVPEDSQSQDTILSYFNKFHPKLQFTMEIEKNGQIPFLDLLLIRRPDGSLSIDWYRKPLKSDRYLNYKSHHPFHQKINVAFGLKSRALQLSDKCYHKKNLKLVKNILSLNHFPKKLINSIVHNSRTINCEGKNPQDGPYMSLTYVKGLSEQLGKTLKASDKNIAYKNQKTLGSILFSKLKSPIRKEKKSNVVYKIPCGGCDGTYVGITGQRLGARIYQHKYDSAKMTPCCALAQHSVEQKHKFDFDNTTVICAERNPRKREILEMINILQDPKTVNKKTDTHKLSKIYHKLIMGSKK